MNTDNTGIYWQNIGRQRPPNFFGIENTKFSRYIARVMSETDVTVAQKDATIFVLKKQLVDFKLLGIQKDCYVYCLGHYFVQCFES